MKEELLLDPWEETVLRLLQGPGQSSRVEMLGAAEVGGRDFRVPVALRQPSRGLLTQKGCRHGANLPMEEGPGLELR